MPVAKPDPDRQLTHGQYRQILHTLARKKRGEKNVEGYKNFADILYTVSDYYDNVDKKGYDHSKYLQYLFENKDVPRELLELIPRIKY